MGDAHNFVYHRHMENELPLKKSVTIKGHRTSVSLEPVFWEALNKAATEEGCSLNALITQIDQERPGNLSSALRVWLFERLHKRTVQRC